MTEAEFEALRLRHEQHYKQIEAATELGISQTTYSRILTGAYEKLTQALLHGHAIALQSHRFTQECPMDIQPRNHRRKRNNRSRSKQGQFPTVQKRSPLTQFKGWGCNDCGYIWKDAGKVPIKPFLDGNPECPECHSKTQTYRLIKKLTNDRK